MPRLTLKAHPLFALLMVILAAAPYASIVQGSGSSSRPIVHFASSDSNPIPTIADFPSPPMPAPMFAGPVRGVIRILVVLAAFSDINYTTSPSAIRQEYFGTVANYYREDSYGVVSLQGDVIGWYNLNNTEAHYGRDCTAIDDADCSGSPSSWQIAQDVIYTANKAVNLTNYDYLIVIHSGFGEESSRNKNDVWSVTYLGGIWIRATQGNSGKGRSFDKFAILPELEAQGAVPIGVYAHESGHLLGLPDLYDTSNGKSIMGPWSLMDKGLWNGQPPGSSPAHMEAWSKIRLGWINGSLLAVANTGNVENYTLDPSEVNSNNVHVVKIPVSANSPPSQYYLVEVREHIGFDSGLPAQGVLITYIDETLYTGRVKVMNAHPNILGLLNATWTVGQVFIDDKADVAVAITGQVGNAYQITVNRLGPMADLAVSKIYTQPTTISPNTTVTIFVDITNQGTLAATNVPVQILMDDQPFSSNRVSVKPGATQEISVTWNAVAGTHTLRVVIDPQNTLKELSRTNNVATYTLMVGPTLIITVPLNATTGNATAWVRINGVQFYPGNSSQVKTSVPPGNVIVEVDPEVSTGTNVRQVFEAWSDGNNQNPRQITVNSDTSLQALYKAQYYLTVDGDGGVTTLSGWFDANSTVTVVATSPSNVTEQVSRMLFTGWSGDVNSTSTSFSVTMTKPVTVRANWKTQYYLNVVSSVNSISGSGWYDIGSTATIAAQSPVQLQNNTRQIFVGWVGPVSGQSTVETITVNAPTIVQARWTTQYMVEIQSAYGDPQGAGWHDAGSDVQISLQPEVAYSNRTRRVFVGWTGDYSGASPEFTLNVQGPKTLVAHWITQYELKFSVQGIPNSTSMKLNINNVMHDVSVPTAYQAWFNEGEQINPTTNQTVRDQFIGYSFAGWKNSTGGAVSPPFTVTGPEDYTATYTNMFSLPPLPGFPVESILAGLMLGLVVLGFTKRRRRESR